MERKTCNPCTLNVCPAKCGAPPCQSSATDDPYVEGRARQSHFRDGRTEALSRYASSGSIPLETRLLLPSNPPRSRTPLGLLGLKKCVLATSQPAEEEPKADGHTADGHTAAEHQGQHPNPGLLIPSGQLSTVLGLLSHAPHCLSRSYPGHDPPPFAKEVPSPALPGPAHSPSQGLPWPPHLQQHPERSCPSPGYISFSQGSPWKRL